MKVIGLTGGIGSGKSTIARVFEVLGIAVYNSDERAKKLYFNAEIKKQVEALLGKEAYESKTKLNKKHISLKIFSDKALLEKLNAIIHPAVGEDFELFKKNHAKEKYIVKESALLLEANLLKDIDKLLVVTSNDKLRTQRVNLRDGLNEAEIKKIIDKQLPDEAKIKKADWVIENNEEELLIPQVLKINKELSK